MADEYGWENPGAWIPDGNFNSCYAVGWQFSADVDDIMVKGLRIVANYAENHKLNLYDTTDGSIVGTVTVTGVVGSWVEGMFGSAVELVNGRQYVVSTNAPATAQHYYFRSYPESSEFNTDRITLVQGRIGTTADVMPGIPSNSTAAVDIIFTVGGSAPAPSRRFAQFI
jgi:hypothetical protein